MSTQRPDDRIKLQRRLISKLFLAGLAFVFGWVPYVWAVLFNRDVLGHGGPPGAVATQVELYLGLLVAVIASLSAWIIYRRISAVMHRGVRGEATIVKIGGVSSHGIRPVKYMFQVNGLTYTFTRDTVEIYLKALGQSRNVPIIYDPGNPNQCEIIFDKITAQAPAAATQPEQRGVAAWIESFWHQWRKAALALLLTANILVVCSLAKLLGVSVGNYGLPLLLTTLAMMVAEDLVITLTLDRYLGEPSPLFAATRRWIWVSLGVLVVAIPTSVVWINRDQAEELARQQRQAEEDKANFEQMHAASEGLKALRGQGAAKPNP